MLLLKKALHRWSDSYTKGGKLRDILICTVAEVSHPHVENDRMIDILEKGSAVSRNEGEVIEGIKPVYQGGSRRWPRRIVD